MDLNTWLENERGRSEALAVHIGVTNSAISQWKTNGVPVTHMEAVRDFSGGQITLEQLVSAAAEARDRAARERAADVTEQD